MAEVCILAPREFLVSREVWDFREASRQLLEKELAAIDWDGVLAGEASLAAEKILEKY